MDLQANINRTEPARLLAALDAGFDPYRFVRLCCTRADGDTPSVTLLVPGGESAVGDRLRKAAELLKAAGLRLDDVVVADGDGTAVERLVRCGGFDALVVCPARGQRSSPMTSLAVGVADARGLEVLGTGHQAGWPASWLRRLVDPLLQWAGAGEPAP